MINFVCYCRRSTQSQDNSFEAQMQTINTFVSNHNGSIVGVYKETAMGDDDTRPLLKQAVYDAVSTGSVLIVSHTDRLARSGYTIARLNEISNLRLCVASDGALQANALMLGIKGLLAQEEKQAIRRRIKDAIAVIKASGRTWGNGKLGQQHGANGRKSYKNKCNAYAETIVPRIKALRLSGINSYTGIANQLNLAGFKTINNKKFYPQTIKNLCLTYSI